MERSNDFNNYTMQIEEYIICINDEIKVNQVREKRENPSLQSEVKRVSQEFDEKKTKQILQQLHTQRKNWRFHNRIALCWSFYCVNDNSKINLDDFQMMCYLFCHSQLVFMN